MMKRGSLFLLALLAVGPPSEGRAQSQVTGLQALTVQIWPDYDRPSVLVMLTGNLGPGAPAPAVVNLPLPSEAQLNAVARIDASGKMIADIVYSTDAGKLTLATPDPSFRVEYYLPYRVDGDMRVFAFSWLADLAVGELSVLVQKPARASSLVTRPEASRVVRGKDGLDYHVLPARAVARGEAFSLQLTYPAVALSTLALGNPEPAAPPPPAPAARRPAEPAPMADGTFGWALIAVAIGAAGLSMAFTWRIAKNRFAAGRAGSSPPESEAVPRACPGCGRPSGEEDRFCSSCGSALSL